MAATRGTGRTKAILSQLLPGMVLPGLIYLLVSPHAPVLLALCAASSVPFFDALFRLCTGRAPNLVSVLFLGLATLSVGLALWSGESMFILARGAAVSGAMGIAFALSALAKRPLTRTLAIRLSSEHTAGRRWLAERWRHPKALSIFRVLSVGWGLLLLFQSIQQTVVVLTLSPGTVLVVEPPLQALATAAGVIASVMYARRIHASHPELQLLSARSS